MQYFSDSQLDAMFRLLDFKQLEQMGYDLSYSPEGDLGDEDFLESLLESIEEDFSGFDREQKIAELREIGAFDDDYLVSEVKMGAETKRQKLKREKEEAAMDEAATDVDYMREHYSESDAYIYAYNDGHTDSRGGGSYRPSATDRELTSFKKIFKQAESGYLGQGVDAPRGWDNQGNPLDTNRPRGSERWNAWYGITKDGEKIRGNILVYIINEDYYGEDRKKNNRLAQEKANEIVQKRGLKEITLVQLEIDGELYPAIPSAEEIRGYKDTGFTIVDGNDEETFAADSPFNTLLMIREDIIIDDEEDFDRLLSIYMSLETDIAQLYQETNNPKHPLLGEMMRYRNRIANRLDELQEEVAIQDTIEMDAEGVPKGFHRMPDGTIMADSAHMAESVNADERSSVPFTLEQPIRTGYKLGLGWVAAALTIPLAIVGIGAFYNQE